jgi:hypothetical protein
VVFNPRWADYVDIGSVEFFHALGFGEALASGAFDYQLSRSGRHQPVSIK